MNEKEAPPDGGGHEPDVRRSVFGTPCAKIQFEALGINLFAEDSRD